MPKVKTSISLKPELLAVLRSQAKSEGRTLSNYLDHKLRQLCDAVTDELSKAASGQPQT